MNITHIITTIEYGGAEKQLLLLVKKQFQRGHNISVIFLKGNPEMLHAFNTSGAKVIESIANRPLFLQCLSLLKYCKSATGILHAHLPQAELMAAVFKFGMPLVVSRHVAAQFAPKFPSSISLVISKFISKRSKCVIAISEAVARHLAQSRELGPNTDVQVVHYGYESLEVEGNVSLREYYGLDKGTYLIGTISRLVSQKDIPTLLRAFQIVNSAYSDSRLMIVGGGELENELKELSRDLGVAPYVIWVGRTQDVRPFLKTMDVFCLTTTYEGFGLVLLEAIEAQIPIVASNNSSIPEVLGQQYKYLCDTGSEIAFAESLLALRSHQLREDTNEYLAGRIMDFSPDVMVDAISNIYSKYGP
jgi:glycosyltransferase involved in cell wall biosynthesis